MDPLTIGFGVTSALGAAGQFAGRLLGAGARQDEINQRIHALQMKKEQTLSTTQARAAASGITLDSASVETYLSTLAGEFDREIAALKRSGSNALLGDIIGGVSGLAGAAGGILGGLNSLGAFGKGAAPGAGYGAGVAGGGIIP